jgi:hypothetical protein
MRAQAQLGQRDAIHRTLDLLRARMRDLDDHPSPDTLHLASRLLHQEGPSQQ